MVREELSAAVFRRGHGVLLAMVLLGVVPASADRLPFRVFTAADGLRRRQRTRDILQSSRGFLWIGTGSGLSRFDGERSPSRRDPKPGPASLTLFPD